MPNSEAERTAVDRREKLGYLRRIDLLQELSAEDLQAIDALVPLISYGAGTVLYEPGRRLNRLFFLKRGQVRLYQLSPDGKQLTLALLRAGNIFGETDTFATGAGTCYAEALTDALVCTMTTADLMAFMMKRPRVALRLIQILSRELKSAQELAATLALRDVRTRVLHLLTKLAAEYGECRDGEFTALDLKLTHQDLAHMVGATRESVSAVLGDLGRKAVVQTSRGRLAIRCEEAARLLEGDLP
ncbi:MAG: Crp/Fnr family transcriptional regulator [Thermaerobacter sp.]|nr:Crp/Fnr family transcriptional regulator [Thermaerobacter sp.]